MSRPRPYSTHKASPHAAGSAVTRTYPAGDFRIDQAPTLSKDVLVVLPWYGNRDGKSPVELGRASLHGAVPVVTVRQGDDHTMTRRTFAPFGHSHGSFQ